MKLTSFSKASRFTPRTALYQPTRTKPVFWYLCVVFIGLLALVGCETAIPTSPPITVNITAISNTTAVAQGVKEAIAATNQANVGLTETVFAQGGVTLTPSDTPTATLTPTITPTRFASLTPTPVPTFTATSTFAPYPTNSEPVLSNNENGWVRVVHAWREIGSQTPSNPVDVYLGDDRIARALPVGGQTNYYEVGDTVRITIRDVDSLTGPNPPAPIASSAIQIPKGSIITVVSLNYGKGVQLLPVQEDPTPLSSGMSRMTIIQGNQQLLPVNPLLPLAGRALSYNLNPGDVVGPFDLPSGIYPAQLNDAKEPDQTVYPFKTDLNLASRVSYLLITLPSDAFNTDLTDYVLVSGTTRRIDSDISARFINLTSGTVVISLDGNIEINSLASGAVSDLIPISKNGSAMRILNTQDYPLNVGQLGPWKDDEKNADKLILLTDGANRGTYTDAIATVLSQSAQPSVINASVRLVHALPNTQPLALQIRPVRTKLVSNTLGTPQPVQLSEDENPWITLGREVEKAGLASPYVGRAPDMYDVRAVYSGTRTTLGEIDNVKLLAGGIYDFTAMPGLEPGSVRLMLLQPAVQVTGLVSGDSVATAVFESVEATLTSMAPSSTETPTQAVTPTDTRTPVPTNTPRPSNTPSAPPPSLRVDPAPPNAANDSITLNGANYTAKAQVLVTVDTTKGIIASGQADNNGNFSLSIPISRNWNPGPHTLNVCVGCPADGSGQPEFLIFIVADPDKTPTPTVGPL